LAQSGFSMPIVPNAGNGNINDLQAPNNISNPQTNVIGTNSGCMLAGENQPTWFIFKVCNTGNFELLIGSSINQFPQAGFYDWSIWKYTSTTCAKILNNQLAPVRCNWNAAVSGGTGVCDTLSLPNTGVKGNYEPPLFVNAGDSLIICINNYSGVNYFIDFLSVGTSSINCPVITSINANEIPKQKPLFYNRNSNKIHFLDKDISEIRIHDLQGKEVLKTKIEEHRTIDCSNFIKGIYFVTYYRKENLPVTEKILID
jgi:hypothetical protein